MPVFRDSCQPFCPFMIRVHLNQQCSKRCPHAADDS